MVNEPDTKSEGSVPGGPMAEPATV
ncbi:MAG: hypothetical protein QOG19_2351, partial [Mycobacterium sp.]|nr:hypothetical protein [Mycobacterium sp.]